MIDGESEVVKTIITETLVLIESAAVLADTRFHILVNERLHNGDIKRKNVELDS